jgi:hypothetical protein
VLLMEGGFFKKKGLGGKKGGVPMKVEKVL